MANRYYGAAIGGDKPQDVTRATSTTGKDIEVVVNLAPATMDKLAVIKALLAITDFVITDGF